MSHFNKWVSMWGNATSISDQTEKSYAKNLTLRYPIKSVFNGDALKITFSNLTGTEPITIRASVMLAVSDKEAKGESIREILLDGRRDIVIPEGQTIISDEIPFSLNAGDYFFVSIYLKDYTQMNSGVLVTGPLSKGFYSYGDFEKESVLPADLTRNTNWFYFLNKIDIMTDEENYCICCYGDSITAQSWPDYLSIKLWNEGKRNVAVVRRAVSGTRMLREYDCITYAAYGLKGKKRFEKEVDLDAARYLIIQHGINDIIHPVGEEINPFRPMSDLPKLEEMTSFYDEEYLKKARKMGYEKVYTGTLLPILGWRTYADFREELKNQFNEYLRTTDAADGCIDFDKALRDEADVRAFKKGYDSGDHLHPSESAYERMAEEVYNVLYK